MATDIVLLHYNNYFNRTIKVPGNTLANYTAIDADYTKISSANFNPADGVNTTLIVGKGEAATTGKELHSYDYLLVVGDDTNNTVLSRWFIIDENNTRDGQYQFTLRRDVIADNYDVVKYSTTFIEKAMISDVTNPLLYSNENCSFNQIKQSETLLKDSTGCGWVVGYIPQDAFATETTITKNVVIQSTADVEVAGLSNWTYYNTTNFSTSREIWASSALTKEIKMKTKLHYPAYSNPTAGINWPEHKLKGTLSVVQNGSTTATQDSSASSYDDWSGVVINKTTGAPSPSFTTNTAGYVTGNMASDATLWSNLADVLTEQGLSSSVVIKTSTEINNLAALDGKILKDTSTGSYYRIALQNVSASGSTIINPGSSAVTTFLSRLNDDIVRIESGTGGATTANTVGNYTTDNLQIGYNGTGYQLELTQVITNAAVKIDNTRNHVIDAPYDMFCIPYSDTKSLKIDNSHTVLCNKELAIGMAQEIAQDAGTGSIYDTQLLPYCPCIEIVTKNPNIYADDATIDVSGLSLDVIYNTGNVSEYLGAIMWCTSSIRTFDIDTIITVSSDPMERKVENECDMYRLCSGNYQGIFEFNAAKSYGVSGFRVDCAFKPYNPYIHVVPKLGGLYGANFADFKDSRGLICGGEFSLAQMSNTWANYELQNKNYNNIFERQIQNMEVNYKWSQVENLVGSITGSAAGAASGAAGGMMLGGPTGAIIGGVAGGVTSLAGGLADLAIGQQKYAEAKSYARDMYDYNVGNIKAIPTSISKNTALTPNTKIFPFVEKYTCTDVEKQALQNKLTYNGMTIMVIGTIDPYIGTGFLKGQVIRFIGLNEDSHMANAIYEEINKGVYL